MGLFDKILNTQTKKRFFNAILFGIGGTIISKAFLMLFNVIAARILGETKYGIYSLINNTVQTFIVFAGAGIGVTLTRYVALYRDKDKDMTGIVIKTLLIFNTILSAIISVIVFAFSDIISNLLSQETNISLYIKITAGTIFFTSIASILQSILQGFEEYKTVALMQMVSNLLMLVIGIIITNIFDILGTIITLLILQVISTVLFGISIKKIINSRQIKLRYEINQTIKIAIRDVAVPAFLSTIFATPILWITNFIFTRDNSYEEFAAFSVCLQWFTILNYLPQQLGQVKPIYTQLYADGNMEEFKRTIKKMIKISTILSVLATIVIMIGSYFLLKMYGNYYLKFILPFNIMMIASIFFALQSQFGSIFQAIGKIWTCFWLNLLWAVIFIVCFMFLCENGVVGYTITYLISYVVYTIISIIVFYKSIVNIKEERKSEKVF